MTPAYLAALRALREARATYHRTPTVAAWAAVRCARQLCILSMGGQYVH